MDFSVFVGSPRRRIAKHERFAPKLDCVEASQGWHEEKEGIFRVQRCGDGIPKNMSCIWGQIRYIFPQSPGQSKKEDKKKRSKSIGLTFFVAKTRKRFMSPPGFEPSSLIEELANVLAGQWSWVRHDSWENDATKCGHELIHELNGRQVSQTRNSRNGVLIDRTEMRHDDYTVILTWKGIGR